MFAPVTDDNVPRIVALINWAYRGSGAGLRLEHGSQLSLGERTTEDLLRADLVAKPDASLLK
jgi:aspartate oxidase